MGVHVHVSDEAVDITFTGLDRWLTCNPRGQRLAMDTVTGAAVVPRDQAATGRGLRVGGGHWPGRMATGWFAVRGRKGLRELWCAYRDPDVLVIDTTLTKPCRVVLQHPDRHDLAWFVGERLGRRPPS